ncbi:MAG: arginase family protein, partial [Tidjanibacter sp.]|nr:arginase family protein [Tidjanibacter sp.]
KIVGLVGGDHSTPLGVIKAVAKHHKGMGILHIDAHRDLRKAYEGFQQSHASIMFNVLSEVPRVSRIVQVGARDYCSAEAELAATDERVVSFEQALLDERRFAGESWSAVCQEIVEALPKDVYISFDIDGLSPDNCPSTGTPVPGGLSFGEAVHLIKSVVRSGRRIVGFDLVEVACGKMGDYDANVGARMLYKLCCQTLKSNPRE